MAGRPKPSAADLVGDPGVLERAPTLEVFGYRGATVVDGLAVLPHRGQWLRARASGVEAFGWFDDVPRGPFEQAVVHLQKGRDATQEGLVGAWRRLAEGGRLLLVGGNDLGVKSAVKRLAADLDEPAEILVNRARARVACWRKGSSNLTPPTAGSIEVVTPGDRFALRSAPGVFSADGLDPGTALLLLHLAASDPPTRVFDAGCGLGVLGLAALRTWPSATAVVADVDRRSVDCASRNASELGLARRCSVRWWDAVTEAPPVDRCDLAVVNPPFHSGVPVDLQPARAIFRAVGEVLEPGGRALVVANRTLPWERDLRDLGKLRQIDDRLGYKVLEIAR